MRSLAPLALALVAQLPAGAVARKNKRGKMKEMALIAPELGLCGELCRDLKEPAPLHNLAENKILPQIDNMTAIGSGEVLECPELAQLVPCAAGAGADAYSAPCSSCIQDPSFQTTLHRGSLFTPRQQPITPAKEPIHLIVVVPPFQGSSGLEGLLSTSPTVSTMCAKSIWQCEATATLLRENVFPRTLRYDPAYTNWSRVYEVYNSLELGSIWDDPTKPILMDKSPPNIVKTKGMIEFFEKTGREYRFVAMARHPCMYNSVTETSFSLLMGYMRDMLANVPQDKIYTISYNDFVTRPDMVAQGLLDWLPELGQLDINASYLEWPSSQGNGLGRPPLPGTDLVYHNGEWTRTGTKAPPKEGVPAPEELQFLEGRWSRTFPARRRTALVANRPGWPTPARRRRRAGFGGSLPAFSDAAMFWTDGIDFADAEDAAVGLFDMGRDGDEVLQMYAADGGATANKSEHHGRELPVLRYAQRDECRLRVIKKRYNTNDVLPFVAASAFRDVPVA